MKREFIMVLLIKQILMIVLVLLEVALMLHFNL
jgi:hypothetical protein